MKVNHVEHGKPIKPHTWTYMEWYPDREEGEGLAGRGTKRKRTPIYNGLDRDYYNGRTIYSRRYPTRKGADFEGGRD